MKIRAFRVHCAALILLLVLGMGAAAAPKKPLTIPDIMKFRALQDAVIAENGALAAFTLQPDRGDGEAVVVRTADGREVRVARGGKPSLGKDGRWAALAVKIPAADAEKPEKERPKPGLALVAADSLTVTEWPRVEKFALSDDGRWLAMQLFAEEKGQSPAGDGTGKPTAEKKEDKEKKGESGTTVVLRRLDTGGETRIPTVREWAFDPQARVLLYARLDAERRECGLYYRDLTRPEVEECIQREAGFLYSAIVWDHDGTAAAVTAAAEDDKNPRPLGRLLVWTAKNRKLQTVTLQAAHAAAWAVPWKNELQWSRDGGRLFFTLTRPAAEEKAAKKESVDLYDPETILAKREVDVWHWNDARTIPTQKLEWEKRRQPLYRAVWHADSGRVVPLADESLPQIGPSENPRYALGSDETPYLRELRAPMPLFDLYLVDLANGRRTLLAKRVQFHISLSPGGGYAAYFLDRQWYIHDIRRGLTRCLTADLATAFWNEENDTPGEPPPYGLAGWTSRDAALLLYDRYDIWRFPTAGGAPHPLTSGEGRRNGRRLRRVTLDKEALWIDESQPSLLTAHDERGKQENFALLYADGRLAMVADEPCTFTFVAKARHSPALLYTRESYREFPDLWLTDLSFSSPRRLSTANPDLDDFAWGRAELVEWRSLDNVPLQGVLIRPDDWQPGKRCPVLIYFYELMSDLLHTFNVPVISHRPIFAYYASHGYAVFLPDIRYEIGRPGLSALKCLQPGVQKLIDMGVADPKAIGLHGHSWGGYETAWLVTQTDMFAAAVAGAAVTNMTSAYNGIRWESGLPRQWQYEKAQSRIGGTLWQMPLRYLENSPVFYADRVKTPLLLEFGDEDGAVPWYQGIEFYLSLRRLGKPCIMLQYRGEPHHLKKYPNKLDYFIKMKEFFDHYLCGAPAPEWLSRGVAYRGK